jgi:secreted trypsin-like serine protease
LPGLVTGGDIASKGNYPWQVSFINKKTHIHFCGGTLIDSQHVLTAAHCFKECTSRYCGIMDSTSIKDKTFAVIGKHNLQRIEDSAQTFKIKQVNIHQDFDSTTYANDIALIQLDGKVSYNSFAIPACLPFESYNYIEGDEVLVTGWGSTEEEPDKKSSQLRVGKMKIKPTSKCQEDIADHCSKNKELCQKNVTEHMFCASEVCVDSCKGDSGGPVMKEMNHKFQVIGIVSYGPYPCNKVDNPPGIYIKVTEFLDWIRAKLSQDSVISICQHEEFSCQDGSCLPGRLVCNGKRDCKK